MNRREYTVGDCFYQIRNGANIKQGDAAGGYPITRIETTANDTFNRDRMGYAGITDLSKYEGYVLEDGDLLMSHINSVQYLGRTVLYRKQGNETIIHGMNLLSLKANREIILPEFARYSFRSDPFKKQLSKITKKSVNQASFTVADLKKIPLAVPMLNEQRGIVQTLDKCLLVEAKRQQQLSALDDLIKARFVEMFGACHERKRLEDYASLITKGASPKWQGIEYCDEGTLFVTSENVREGYVDLSKRKYLPDDINKILPRSVLNRNDILINIVGASIGRAAVYESDELANINQAVALVRLIPNAINNAFLLSFLNGEEAQKAYIAMKKGGARDNLSLKNIADLQIPVATVKQQNAFAAFVAQIDKSKAAIQKSLDETQLLFDSLMQKYFG